MPTGAVPGGIVDILRRVDELPPLGNAEQHRPAIAFELADLDLDLRPVTRYSITSLHAEPVSERSLVASPPSSWFLQSNPGFRQGFAIQSTSGEDWTHHYPSGVVRLQRLLAVPCPVTEGPEIFFCIQEAHTVVFGASRQGVLLLRARPLHLGTACLHREEGGCSE